jgi:hypothetical protein
MYKLANFELLINFEILVESFPVLWLDNVAFSAKALEDS